MNLEEQAKIILEQFPIHRQMPASLSGKYHIGETQREHLELAVNVMKHMCKEFNITNQDKDMLIAATYLHDMGLYVITKEGNIQEPGWDYYPETNYSRLYGLMQIHPTVGAALLSDEKFKIDRKPEIQNLIRKHMSHWYKMEPQPGNLYEYLICISDYIASKGKGIFEYNRGE